MAEDDLDLPDPFPALGTFVSAVRTGNLVFSSGHVPHDATGTQLVTGKLGADLTTDDGYAAARLCGLSLLATLRHELGGSLDAVVRIVSLLVTVNATPDFVDHTAVANGASDLLVEILGAERGMHARLAVGVSSLPANLALEIQAVVEVAPAAESPMSPSTASTSRG
jgi:enamine deaminase RidA (YjgF/YER057c/UK114 family)